MATFKKLTILLPFLGFGIISGPPFQLGSVSHRQEVVQLQKTLQHEVSVTLKLIQVYVTDKKGNPVQDLRKSDFVVYDNGQKEEITEFERHILARPAAKAESRLAEEKTVQTPLALPDKVTVMPRKFFLFFDFAFNNQKGVNKSREAALHFIDKELNPSDEVGLLSYSVLKGLSIHEYLTANHRKVREAVEFINAKDIAGRAEDIEEEYWRRVAEGPPQYEEERRYQKSDSLLLAERQESKRQAQEFILKITALAKALRYVPGQKNIILFSTGIVSSLLYGNKLERQVDQNKIDAGDFVLQTKNEEMLKELTAANCTVFTFDTREAALVSSMFAYDQQTFEQHNRNIFTQGGGTRGSVNVLRDDHLTGWYSISRISKATGGKYFSNIGEYAKNLDQVQTMTGTYYVLGYYISDQKDGAYHEIKVEVAKKGFEVRAQTGYFNPKPFREYSALEKELHLFDLALTERPLLQTPVGFSMTALAYMAGEGSRLEVLSKIPDAAIQKFSGKKVELVGFVFDESENLASLERAEVDLRKYRGTNVFYTSAASLDPGSYKCRLVLRDLETGGAAVASTMAIIAHKTRLGLSLFSLLLLAPGGDFVYLEGAAIKKKDSISWRDIYPYDRARYSPIGGEVAQGVSKIYAVVPCSIAGIFLPNISFKSHLINSSTGQKFPLALSILNKSQKGDIEIRFVEFSLPNIPPGKYLLYLHAEETGTKFVSDTQTPLIVK